MTRYVNDTSEVTCFVKPSKIAIFGAPRIVKDVEVDTALI